MKKQFISIFSAVILLIAGVAMMGCNKNEPEQPAKVQTYHVSIQAGKGDANQQNGPRKALGLDGNTLTASWAAGEQVSVRNVTKGTDLTNYLVAQSNGVQTMIAGDLIGTINAGDELLLRFLSPDYTNQQGTIDYIAEHCDYAEATIHVKSVTWGSITFEENIADFHNRQAIAKFTLMNEARDAVLAASDLKVEVDNRSYNIHVDSATSVIFVALPGFTDKTVKLTATVGSDTYTFTSPSGKTFEDGKYYAITVGMSKEEQVVHGFSVSPTKQIEFAHGNLQYKKSTNTWRIAKNQYDFVGTYYTAHIGVGDYFYNLNSFPVGNVYEGSKCNNTDDTYDKPRTDSWVDYFGWNTVNDPLKISANGEDYGTQTDFVDWGTKEIYDGDVKRPANYWRTPTIDEWGYIFEGRENAENLFSLASIEGLPNGDVKGVIVLPDDFVLPAGLTFESITAGDISFTKITGNGTPYYRISTDKASKWPNTYLRGFADGVSEQEKMDTINNVLSNDNFIYNKNRYTLAQWAKLEAAGAVFLPAAGIREVWYTDYTYTETCGVILFANFNTYYWSTTHMGAGHRDAHYFKVDFADASKTINPWAPSQPVQYGMPVRLVRDLQ